MQPIFLIDLAERKSAWLAARQAVVAGNVANANTPGYRPKDVSPFDETLAQTQLTLASTSPGHIEPPGAAGLGGGQVVETRERDSFDAAENGNEVGVEGEMTKAGAINRDYALATDLLKSFHAMLMASLKS